ncbi:MAG: class I SAM-dependent DNA methyltransferase [Clostridia bacterium]|nr:class I SAM-dependent DNA methyltransferase [Clostridia bacterium]
MTTSEQKKAAALFIKDWIGRGDEKQDTQSYWIQLLRTVYGAENPEQYITFEKPVARGFIDGYIADTLVLIEQKGAGINLDDKEPRQGKMVTPYEQARDYVSQLGSKEKPDYIITSNFQEFRIYDTSIQPRYDRKTDTWYSEYELVKLEDLVEEAYRMNFLVNIRDKNIKKEQELSESAGRLVGLIYDELLKQYKDPEAPETLKSLNKLCVRLVFCLYAEDSGVFPTRLMFHDYLMERRTDARDALIKLFSYLNTPDDIRKNDNRWLYEKEDLLAFPYVNGGMFENDNIIIPQIPSETVDLILQKASAEFNWSDISCTIFGGVFESTLNPETRRSGGMHYTSIENIHKVIDPLFMDDLNAEFDEAMSKPTTGGSRTKALQKLHNKLGTLTFFDPACGSGNFLTESYLSLRKLENRILEQLKDDFMEGQTTLSGIAIEDMDLDIKVSIQQFYGIEINDFAVSVAKTALWISEAQMLTKTLEIEDIGDRYLPLKTYTNIHEGNALKTDWNTVIPSSRLNYIIGNPPFVGGMYMSAAQKEITRSIFENAKGAGEFDYVCCWYKKALDYTIGTNICCAFVSTNSICQGEQVTNFWKYLYDNYQIHINFAYTTFIWNNTTTDNAKVHCIIIGFSNANIKKDKYIISESGRITKCDNINAYLTPGENFFVEPVSKPICNVPAMKFGSMPRDGGGFVLSEEEKDELIAKEPLSEKWIKPYIGAAEFLNNKKRYCLWMVGAEPSELKKCPTIMQRIEFVKEFRANSKAEGTRKFAATPTLFCQIAQPNSDYIMVPKTTSGRRRYVPMGFQPKDVIASDLVFLIPNAGLYEFGVLMSNAHNAWMRLLAGRLKSDYRYSKDIVYNTFPWPNPSESQKTAIENTAQQILDARLLYPNSTLADLYDPDVMPPELTKAHIANNQAVLDAYGLKGTSAYYSEDDCVSELIKLYQSMV